MPSGPPDVGLPRYWGPMFPDAWGTATYWNVHFEDKYLAPGQVGALYPEGAGTFQLVLESGSSVTYRWKTYVFKSESGLEKRTSYNSLPQEEYKGSALMIGSEVNVMRSRIARYSALGTPFLLGLPYEAMILSDDSSGARVFVANTFDRDWSCYLNAGRVIIEAADGQSFDAVIQDIGSNYFDLLPAPPANIGMKGGQIMPAKPVFLKPQQGFARYTTGEQSTTGEYDTVEYWSLDADAAIYYPDRFGAVGPGQTAFKDKNVWTRRLIVDQSAADSVQSMNEILDMGATKANVQTADTADWGRQIYYRSNRADEFQWVKGMINYARGRWKSFFLPSWRHDLTYVADGDHTLDVSGDINSRYPFVTTIQIQYENDDVQYLDISNITDLGNGISRLKVDDILFSFAGPVRMISWLELVRLESDDVEIPWDGALFTVDLKARVVVR